MHPALFLLFSNNALARSLTRHISVAPIEESSCSTVCHQSIVIVLDFKPCKPIPDTDSGLWVEIDLFGNPHSVSYFVFDWFEVLLFRKSKLPKGNLAGRRLSAWPYDSKMQ